MFKEALRSIYRQAKDSYHARMAFHRWCKLAEETGIPELKTMARTIRNKLDGIVTYWTFRHISNAKMEGFNNKIISRKADKTESGRRNTAAFFDTIKHHFHAVYIVSHKLQKEML